MKREDPGIKNTVLGFLNPCNSATSQTFVPCSLVHLAEMKVFEWRVLLRPIGGKLTVGYRVTAISRVLRSDSGMQGTASTITGMGTGE